MAKGGEYERDTCRLLTKWWTGDESRDTLWWRTSQSGGRATTRHKKGQKVGKAHVGDITAVDPEGQPLTALVTIEIKRGYSSGHTGDILDKGTRKKGLTQFEEFVAQTIRAANRAETPYWMLIHRRDHKVAMVYIPRGLFRDIKRNAHFDEEMWPGNTVRLEFHLEVDGTTEWVQLVGLRLDDFLEAVPRKVIESIYEERKQ